MHISEVERLPWLTTEQLERVARMYEAEALVEQERAYAASNSARAGTFAYGPESYEQLAAIKQRMADGRFYNAAIYRLAAQVRLETGSD